MKTISYTKKKAESCLIDYMINISRDNAGAAVSVRRTGQDRYFAVILLPSFDLDTLARSKSQALAMICGCIERGEGSAAETIRVIDEDEARRFIKANADIGTYMDYFDAVEA